MILSLISTSLNTLFSSSKKYFSSSFCCPYSLFFSELKSPGLNFVITWFGNLFMIRKSGLGSHSYALSLAAVISIHSSKFLLMCLDFQLHCNIHESRNMFLLTGKVHVHYKCSINSFECMIEQLKIYRKILIVISIWIDKPSKENLPRQWRQASYNLLRA